MTGDMRELLKRGRNEFRAGNLKKAEILLLQVVAERPRAVFAHITLADIARKRGDIPAAEQHARQGVEANPREPTAHDALIAIQKLSHGAEALLESCRRAAVEHPDDFGTAYRLGAMLRETRRPDEAVAWLRRALSQAPETYRVELMVAWALFENGKYQDTLSVIRDMQRQGNDTAGIHELAAKVLLQFKQPGKAAAAYQRAVNLNPNTHHYHIGLSAALYQANRLEDA